MLEFAPPQIYSTDSGSFPPHQQQRTSAIHDRPQKRSLFDSKPQQRADSMSRTVSTDSAPVDNIEAVLRSIRSDVEQSEMASNDSQISASVAAGNNCSEEEHNSSVGFAALVSTMPANVPNDVHSYHQATTRSLSQDFLASAGNTPEQFWDNFPVPSSSCDMPPAVPTMSFVMPEAKTATGSVDVCTGSSGPQPAHYASAPSGPQAKLPKYERIFLHDLPPALPLPPVSGSTGAQYPSQEEVIGPKRRKESGELKEKNAIRNWYRQFDQTRTAPVVPSFDSGLEPGSEGQLLKPKNIPFASPYIQTHDASSVVKIDPAVKEFDPSKPPPSARSNAT